MRSQNHQEGKHSKIKAFDPSVHHKKIRKIEILNKYNSLFHQRNSLKREFNSLNSQNFISSINLKQLPKTLQAYYSVINNSKKSDQDKSPENNNVIQSDTSKKNQVHAEKRKI